MPARARQPPGPLPAERLLSAPLPSPPPPHTHTISAPPPHTHTLTPAPQLGSCAVGLRTAQGVVLAVEKRLTSALLVPSSVEKIFELDTHAGCAISGLTADARTLVDYGRVECQSHRFTYDEPLRVESLTQTLCDLAMSFAEAREEEEEGGREKRPRMSRPFGVSLLIAGTDARGPQLLHMDPSGTYVAYDAHAIGAGSEGAITQLTEKYNKAMTLEQGMALVTRVLAVRAPPAASSAAAISRPALFFVLLCSFPFPSLPQHASAAPTPPAARAGHDGGEAV